MVRREGKGKKNTYRVSTLGQAWCQIFDKHVICTLLLLPLFKSIKLGSERGNDLLKVA